MNHGQDGDVDISRLDNHFKKYKPSLGMNPEKHYWRVESVGTTKYPLTIQTLFSEAWHLVNGFKLDFFLGLLLYFAIAGAAFYIIMMILGAIMFFFYIVFLAGVSNEWMLSGQIDFWENLDPLVMRALIIFYGAYFLLVLMVSIPINTVSIGLLVMAQKRVNALRVDLLKDLFSPFKIFWKLLFLQLAIALLCGVGSILLVLPGIYVLIASSFAVPLALIYPNATISQLIFASWRMVNQHFFKILGLGLLLFVINMLALIPFGIGLIWSIPFSYLVLMQLLQKVIEMPEEKASVFESLIR